DQYIANMGDGAAAGFKYFDVKSLSTVTVELSGRGEGELLLFDNPEFRAPAARFPVSLSGDRGEVSAPCRLGGGVRALYFTFRGTGAINFHSFTLKGGTT
ncbi:MAG: alpha-N-arabinofuranosidase, partial [Oscillospiraceae bacterium]|nr:alpha-N-arabinofuranosidase [Oscillospiraceae bacterium]